MEFYTFFDRFVCPPFLGGFFIIKRCFPIQQPSYPFKIFLQETHLRQQSTIASKSKWFDQQFLANGSSSSTGVVILFSKQTHFSC